MTKIELWREYERLSDEKGVKLDGVNYNRNKTELENAICCLACEDSKLEEYFVVIKLKYPNIYRTIKENGDFKTHPFNRMYVYNTARSVLA